MRAWKLGILFGLGLTALPTASAAEPDEISTINLLVVNQARVDRDFLEHAQREAARIYARIGLRLVWIDNESNFSLRLTIIILPDAIARPEGRTGKQMGLTRRPTDGREGVAYVFYQRIQSFAWRAEIGVTRVLGHVMAHEIGHLLLPANSHSANGVMRADWDRLHMERVARGLETFTAEQAELIRRNANNRR